MTSKLYVGNLPFTTTARELQDHFAPVGCVASVDLAFDRLTGRARGFAFVSMSTPDDARRAIDQLQGITLGGRALTINEAVEHDERPPHSSASTEHLFY